MRRARACCLLLPAALILFYAASTFLTPLPAAPQSKTTVNLQATTAERATFRAGAAAVDITPVEFPVIVNGMVEERTATGAQDRLMSRALVLDDGSIKIAIVIVDSLMLPRDLLDDAKEQASLQTSIPPERILIAATHTHSAPSAMPCLGSRADPAYAAFLPGQIVRSIVQANESLQPARAGWAVVQDDLHNHCRRWIFRGDRMMTDPFGNATVRAHMHPGHQSPNHIGPSGPADTDFTLLSVQTPDGRPIAVLGNYAMHYYGSGLVSGDFCGRFGQQFAELLGIDKNPEAFVGLMSQGTSGDSMWPNYALPAGTPDLQAYTRGVAESAVRAYQQISYRTDLTLGMAEQTIRFHRRTPDEQRLAWARELANQVGDRLPRGWSEVYAFEQIHLHEQPEVELRLQAVRIGDLGITAIPDEVYGLTGLKIKARSPLTHTMNIELANGAEGYIPPPEQHDLGGYTTWPARTAGLEVGAEPAIVETLLSLLEEISDRKQTPVCDEVHEYAAAVIESKPMAYWRLGEMDGFAAFDSIAGRNATYEPGIARYLDGPDGSGLQQMPRGNRAAHFAGGRTKCSVPELGQQYSFECWIWNGLPSDASAVTGYFFSRGPEGDSTASGDHLGIGGTYEGGHAQGKLILFNGNSNNNLIVGRTVIAEKQWQHVVFVRDGSQVRVYLNGNTTPEIEGVLEDSGACSSSTLFLGGRTDRMFGLEGRLDECAVYNRPLTAEEIRTHYETAGRTPVDTASQIEPPPLSPDESLAKIHVRPEFEVQLVAAEPLVVDPVAIDWGFDGKLWVAEMADYPSGMDGAGKPGGRIRFLEDRNRDGFYETSTVFLEDVSFPNGVLAWKNGVLVTAAPEIFYAEDTDGDGRADLRKTLFSGFMEGNQQLRVNGLRYGLDNWVYCASGSHHGGYGADSSILSNVTGERTAVGSRDFRIRPDEGLIDPQSGPSQFGRNRDAWGNWFGVQNSYPLWHYVLEDHNIRRNPFFAPPDPKRQVVTPANPRVYPAATPEKRFHSFEQSGRFTSACSAMVYQDQLLFPGSDADEGWSVQHAFTCEPFSNLVQHNIIFSDGVSFRFERDPAETEFDFFASEDRWCRPVMARTGPDGGLWVVDMYRYMIEHPHWLPKEGQDELRPFFRSGDDRGRIYRIVPKGHQGGPAASTTLPSPLAERSSEELLNLLGSSNGWMRESAQRILIQRRDSATTESLRKLVRIGDSALLRMQALATLHAIATLHGQPSEQEPQGQQTGTALVDTPLINTALIDGALINGALSDPHPGVRRAAVQFSANTGATPEVLVRLTEDPDPKVRLQLACTLGDLHHVQSANALAKLLKDADPYVQAAVMSSLNSKNISAVLDAAYMKSPASEASALDSGIAGQLPEQAASLADDSIVERLLLHLSQRSLNPEDTQAVTALAQLMDAVQRRERAQLLSRDRQLAKSIRQAVEQARSTIVKTDVPDHARMAAAQLLCRLETDQSSDLEADRTRDTERLIAVLSPQNSSELQDQVVNRLLELQDPTAAAMLLQNWRSHSPAIRTRLLDAFCIAESSSKLISDAIESGLMNPAEISAAHRQQLLSIKTDELRKRFETIFATSASVSRKEVLEKYKTALTLKADPEHGAQVFRMKCATCHRFRDAGYEVGPNLASLTNKSRESLLTALMDPNGAVEAKYVSYVIATTAGKTSSGILSTETASSLTVMAADAKAETVLRRDIEEMSSTGKSLMPEGLEKDLNPQDVADVMAYLGGQ